MAKEASRNPTIELLSARASCRSFCNRPVPAEVLQQILEAGVRGPTGGNLQPYSIIKIEEPQTRRRMQELCGDQPFISQAPLHLLFAIDWQRSRQWAGLEAAPFTATDSFRMFWISFQDTVICAQNVVTAADALGLGSVYVGMVLESLPELCELFGLPDGVLPVVLLCLGYPKGKLRPSNKLGPEIIVHEECYEEPDDARLRAAMERKYAGKSVEATEAKRKEFARVCREVQGQDFARHCTRRIDQQGAINPAQFYFGLKYAADRIVEDNDIFVKQMEEMGFGWFRRYRPPGR